MTPREWWAISDFRTIEAKAKIKAMAPGPKFSKAELEAMRAMHEKAKAGQ